MQQTPAGQYLILPPGSDIFTVPSVVSVRPVPPFELPTLQQFWAQLENPLYAMTAAQSLGLSQILTIAPLRQQRAGAATLLIREVDALTVRGIPARVMAVLVLSPAATVEVLCWIQLSRWMEFAGVCMQTLAGLHLPGIGALANGVQAVIDPQHTDQVEYQLTLPNQASVPMMAMPTQFNGQIIFNIDKFVVNDQSIKAGNINGTGIVVGHHSVAKVS